jgi:hypothetical protein
VVLHNLSLLRFARGDRATDRAQVRDVPVDGPNMFVMTRDQIVVLLDKLAVLVDGFSVRPLTLLVEREAEDHDEPFQCLVVLLGKLLQAADHVAQPVNLLLQFVDALVLEP